MFKSKRLIILGIVFACIVVFYNCSESAASSTYEDLVTLFNEFREYQEPPINEGLPDYSPSVVEEKYRGLQEFQKKLAVFNINDWPVWQKVDYHLVRSEMNAVYFHHRVLKPWAKNPGFYSMSQGDTGPPVNMRRDVAPLVV